MADIIADVLESPRFDAAVIAVGDPPLVNVIAPPEKKLAVEL
jgi:hypothetical protein